MTDTRIIVFHKHPVSAKVQFLKQAYGGVCGFEPLPELASVLDEEVVENNDNVVSHPKVICQQAENQLGLESDSLEIEKEYFQRVDVPSGVINVYLVGIKGHDTPTEILAEHNTSLHLITAFRGLPPAEMELLRRAYVAVMEG